jgi:glycosyltransferase involved in cell wall biosynthesis
VVGTRVMGVQDVIRHGHTGLLAEPGDKKGLAEAALALLRDPARRQRLAGAALEEVERRAASADQVPRIEALYQSLRRTGRARPSAKLPRTARASAG